MTGGNAPHGRRDNGLFTTDYAVVADVDPRIGEHLLAVLGDRGIAAYLKPTSDEHPVTRSAVLPSPPMDRLYVDRDAVPTALQLLAEATSGAGEISDAIGVTTADPAPGSGGEPAAPTRTAPATQESDEFEAAWALIVAEYDSTTAADRDWPFGDDGTSAAACPPGPSLAPMTDPQATPSSTQPQAKPTTASPEAPADGSNSAGERVIKPARPYLNDDRGSLLDGFDTFGDDLPDDEVEDYKPPAPPPLPRMGPTAIAGVLAVVFGMTAVFIPDLLAALPTTDAQVLGGALVLVGAVLLISRLRPGSDDEYDDPDDGAVV